MAFAQKTAKLGEYTFNVNDKGEYLISTVQDLKNLAAHVNNSSKEYCCQDTVFLLTNNIDFKPTSQWNDVNSTEHNFDGIGCPTSTKYFWGTFDGQGYTISGIRINKSGEVEGVGLFGAIRRAMIKNLRVSNMHIIGDEDVGGICGYSYDSKSIIENCVVDADVMIGKNTETSSYHSGICYGSGNINGCLCSATIVCKKYSFGLSGLLYADNYSSDNIVINAQITYSTGYGATLSGFPF